jgi:hypothetical protein
MSRRIAIALAMLCVLPCAASAQDRPFVFSLNTSATASSPEVRVDYEVGVGDTFRQQQTNGPEQRLGLQASVGRLTFVGNVGVSTSGDSYLQSQQAEMLVSLFAPGASRLALAVGGGVLHEAAGATVLLARVVAGHEWAMTRVHGSVLFEKPLATARDAVDLITSVGWAARITPAWSLGVEAMGEDLEGFWNPQEAEGGSRMLVGPSVHVAPPGKPWQLTVAGGPAFHPSASGRASDALRSLPAAVAGRDYAVRTVVTVRF